MSDADASQGGKKSTQSNRPSSGAGMRLNRFIAASGMASRRKADQLIRAGHVRVNGKVINELGSKVLPMKDQVFVNNVLIKPPSHLVYAVFNKPTKVLTSMFDPEGRPTVKEYLGKLPHVFPVGRLDWDTEGMLLLTNDGDFAEKVSHPRYEIPKTYLAKVSGQPTPEQLDRLRKGVSIVGGRAKALFAQKMSERKDSDKYDWVKIIIAEGKNRQVRQMFEKIGYDVIKLQRVAIGNLKIGQVDRGQYRLLTYEELDRIFEKPKELTMELREKKSAATGAGARGTGGVKRLTGLQRKQEYYARKENKNRPRKSRGVKKAQAK